MDYDFPKSSFYKSLMTGLFVGITVTLLCLVFNYFYRMATGFHLSSIINISTIIFSVNILFLLLGVLFYGLRAASRRGELFFIVLMVLLTLFFVWRADLAHRTNDVLLNMQFRGLLIGDIVVMGLCGALLLPFLFHNKAFNENVI